MTTLMIVDTQVQPGKRDELVALLQGALPDTRTFDGCSGIELQIDQDDPDRLVIIGRWETRDHHGAYRQWRAEGEMPGLLAPLTASQTTSYFDERLSI